MIGYIDSSVILRIIFGEKGALTIDCKFEYILASEILKIECFRTIDRMRHGLNLSDDDVSERSALMHKALRSIKFIKFSDAISIRASQPFPTVIRTLDAIHLSSALIWQEQNGLPLIFLTHDVQQSKAAKAVGFEVVGC